mmetsp:Transcript_171667/g.550255  ORF Transcript_171667/g.550255 Transcript_171667/m.550255 type:complete len:210 (+) Transcript_171667:744-1373(+)
MLQHNHGQGTRLGAVLRSVATLEARVEGSSAADLHAHVQKLREVEDGDELRDIGVPHRLQGLHDKKKAVDHLEIQQCVPFRLLVDNQHAVVLGVRGRHRSPRRLVDHAEDALAKLATDPEASHVTIGLVHIFKHRRDVVQQTGPHIVPECEVDGVVHAVHALGPRRAPAQVVLHLVKHRGDAPHLRLHREGEGEADGHAPDQVVDDGLT